ncbi:MULTISPECIES: RNA polymerase sigma factor [Amycolatopsis]|uniref:Sigma-70 family RNA polymerase sigma factor n=1 Tax=Amycolatopsis albidoflavus TaxID=102226 RepID=A0ABW5IGP9_9PSEU
MAASPVDIRSETGGQLAVLAGPRRSCAVSRARAPRRQAQAHEQLVLAAQPKPSEPSVASETPIPPFCNVRERDDADLIEAVRHGDVAAYGDLYSQHVGSARNLARQLSRTVTEADDLVSEAFIRVLQALRAGGGPDSSIRAYLLTVLRHTAYDRTRKERRVEPSEDITETVDPALVSVPFNDTVTASAERALAKKAFAGLPDRWRKVLWLTEVEGQTPAEVAQSLELTPNGVSALAYRAREALRQGYLQAHLAAAQAKQCGPTIEVLGSWTRSGLPKRQAREVEAHLDKCSSCRALSVELAEINSSFRVAKKAPAKPSDRRKNVRQSGARHQCLRIETGHSFLSMKLAS